MKRIYLAAPYSSADPKVISERVDRINRYAAELMKTSIVFSPISHSHPIALAGELPTDFSFWVRQNHEFIRWADIVCVLMLDGWEHSNGVSEEIDFATSIGKKIIYSYENKKQ
jgi:nucleoside 2-deoxyribosyltransferase